MFGFVKHKKNNIVQHMLSILSFIEDPEDPEDYCISKEDTIVGMPNNWIYSIDPFWIQEEQHDPSFRF